ncbi:MAG: hypothetical protein ABI396_15355 [Ktedonobacteraceae bacterium]
MANYVELNGIRTWYDEQGAGEPLVLPHPGGVGVDSRAFEPNLPMLASHFHVFLPERRGHDHTPDADGPYSYELMAEDTIHFIEQVVGGPARLSPAWERQNSSSSATGRSPLTGRSITRSWRRNLTRCMLSAPH